MLATFASGCINRTLVLFIFESIGTSELILIGIVALIFLGPRKLPSIARTIGKTMADFRNTTNEFKSTWEREVNFEEEAQALRTGEMTQGTVPAITQPESVYTEGISAPEIKEIDASAFNSQSLNGNVAQENAEHEPTEAAKKSSPEPEEVSLSDKKNWL